MIISQVRRLKGEITVPGDKSISHRSIMFSAISKGSAKITGFLRGADCMSTISCFRKMGIDIKDLGDEIIVTGNGLHGLKAPTETLDVGNSGTTTRLISGILSAQKFTSHIDGDESIRKRPMKRIITPLTQMGANITSDADNGCAPLTIQGNSLKAIDYISPVASAQVKSSILLAGLYADGTTSVTEPALSRNHSELMLKAYGANIHTEGKKASISTTDELYAIDVCVPGDISSAAYFITAALIVPGSELLIKNVGINPTRDGIIRVYKEMGGNITILNKKTIAGEEVADLLVKHSSLHGITIGGDIIPTLIDEIPVIAIAAAFATGRTIIKDASELKVKESDRISVVTQNLTAMGGMITPTDDGMIIDGGKPLHLANIDCHMDHRIAMSFAIAGLVSDGGVKLIDGECVNISYPDFYRDLSSISE